MDTGTVLKIIDRNDMWIDVATVRITVSEDDREIVWLEGRKQALSDLNFWLQNYIESQVNQVENEMNRGE